MIKNNNPEFRIVGLSKDPEERERKIKDLIKKRNEILNDLKKEKIKKKDK